MFKKLSLIATLVVSVSGVAFATSQNSYSDNGSGSQAPITSPKRGYAPQGQSQHSHQAAKQKNLPHQVRASNGGHHQKQTSSHQMQPHKININQASATTLKMLPHISEQQAKDIVSYRKKHGDFKSVSDLNKVSGVTIKKNTMSNLSDILTASS